MPTIFFLRCNEADCNFLSFKLYPTKLIFPSPRKFLKKVFFVFLKSCAPVKKNSNQNFFFRQILCRVVTSQAQVVFCVTQRNRFHNPRGKMSYKINLRCSSFMPLLSQFNERGAQEVFRQTVTFSSLMSKPSTVTLGLLV